MLPDFQIAHGITALEVSYRSLSRRIYVFFFLLRPIFERHNAWITRVSYSKDDQIYCSVAWNMLLSWLYILYVYTFEKMKPASLAAHLFLDDIHIYTIYIYIRDKEGKNAE